MKLSQLKQFQAVACTQNITTASKQLYLSQPSVTRTIGKLEQELGVPLFDRSERKLKLNQAGKTVLAYTNLVLKTERAFLDAMQTQASQKPFHLCTASMDLLSLLIPRQQEEFPQMNILYELGQDVNFKYQLLHHKVDLAITDEAIEHPSLESRYLFADGISISVPLNNPLSQCSELTPETLRGQSFVHYLADNPASRLIHSLRQDSQVQTVTLPSLEACSLLLDMDGKYLLALPGTSGHFLRAKADRKLIPLICDDYPACDYYAVFRREDEKKLDDFLCWLQEAL